MPLDSESFSVVMSGGTAIAVAGFFWRLAQKLATTDVKVNTLWDYHIRHSVMTGILNDTLKVNSPIQVTEKGMEWFRDIIPELHEWYGKNGNYKLPDRDLFVALERDLGKKIISQVATPHSIHAGEAMAIAIAICRAYKIP